MAGEIKDMTGKVFGDLEVLDMAPRDQWKQGEAFWICRCTCGSLTTVRGANLRRGSTKSCGCANRKALAAANVERHLNGLPAGAVRRTHGESRSPTYWCWAMMKQRCLNPANANFRWYGGRGISIHKPWITSYEAFRSDMGEKPTGLTLDRIDPDGDYTPANTRWASWAEQLEWGHRRKPYELFQLRS